MIDDRKVLRPFSDEQGPTVPMVDNPLANMSDPSKGSRTMSYNAMDPNRDTVPVFDSERGWRDWDAGEIYTGPKGKGKYVPNIGDRISDWENGFWRVIEVDQTTGLSKKVPWTIPINSNTTSEKDQILGTGPGLFQSEAQRLYVNKNVVPHVMVPDVRVYFYGSKTKLVRFFRGYDTGVNGDVISMYYTNNGEDANDTVPLETVAVPDTTNYSIRRPLEAYTIADLKDGEPVTLVCYNEDGIVVAKEVLLVSETSFIRPVEMGQKYITGISLVSPFMSPNDKSVLEVPTVMSVEGLGLMCRVDYNDSYRLVPIDGSYVRLEGLREYVPTIEGEKIPLTLIYNLSPEEASVVGREQAKKFISRPYWAISKGGDDAYSVKLFPIPHWIDEFQGWSIEWYLYNMERKQVYYVTPYIEWNSNSAPFYPLKYGTMQYLGVSIELSKVDQRFRPHRHTQNLGITLMASGLENTTSWLIEYSKGATALYGKNKEALFTFRKMGDWDLDITCKCESLDEWLDAVFYATEPLFVEGAELRAPTPTHFRLILADFQVEYPIEYWNKPLNVRTGLTAGGGVAVQFIRREPETDLQLGVSPLVVRHTNVSKTY